MWDSIRRNDSFLFIMRERDTWQYLRCQHYGTCLRKNTWVYLDDTNEYRCLSIDPCRSGSPQLLHTIRLASCNVDLLSLQQFRSHRLLLLRDWSIADLVIFAPRCQHKATGIAIHVHMNRSNGNVTITTSTQWILASRKPESIGHDLQNPPTQQHPSTRFSIRPDHSKSANRHPKTSIVTRLLTKAHTRNSWSPFQTMSTS